MNKKRVVVPLRFISEALKAEVEWKAETNYAEIVCTLQTTLIWVPPIFGLLSCDHNWVFTI
ncbi:stalk domain-containing protein [Paenibacillus peoriae]|uniref:stalk domain-containing protein n=1 Tax=Paenibacillus peoriae TaxID=59893 RepID=UPI001F51C3C9|nr:stalk domain-containing protein [Paenibacillus peoriae]MEC0182566.1 stalk domain-containing protein [Paenibacillus peoriae]